VINVRDVVKAYGMAKAVDGVSFTAPEGAVTAFLGPNGAGKTTTLRILLGLARADAGLATIGGGRYEELANPRQTVGAVLGADGFHPGRSGRNHLRIIARSAGIRPGRVEDVLDVVALTDAAGRPVGGYSLGMRQRLALAGALLGDPPVLVLDEPATGLDPAGMAWLRALVVDWAAQGRTVLFSSHVLSEVQLVADRVVIIDRGRVLREGTTTELSGRAPGVVVGGAGCGMLRRVAELAGWRVEADGVDRLIIHGASATEVGRAAAEADIALEELSVEAPERSLEALFFELTGTEPRP
jgi:ABC-2 type transport system ATP-binding protein